jgi:cell wall assembly regulator SMI1
MSDRRTRNWVVGVMGAVLLLGAAVLVGGFFFARSAIRDFFYPPPPPMPAIVQQDTSGLLSKLEGILKIKAPEIHKSLQPGLSEKEIAELEKKSGTKLSDDLRALYRWHNGMSSTNALAFFPGHDFPSLQKTIDEKLLGQQETQGLTSAQRAASAIFAGHRQTWIDIFPDGADGGYFFDPAREDKPGAFFYHFDEDMAYVYFPSFRNFLAGLTECFETGAYSTEDLGKTFSDELSTADAIWTKYGTRPAVE